MEPQIEVLLRRVPALAHRPATVSVLSGGITNRNYRVDVDGAAYVVRIGGENTELLGIDRERELACSCAAAAVGVGAPVIAFIHEHNVLITRYLEGRVLTPEDTRRPEVLRRIAAALRRYHESRAVLGHFSPFDTVRTYYALARQRQVLFPNSIVPALRLLERIEAAARHDDPPCPCHNDLLPANFIDGETIRIVDWEYAAMGDRFFDLGNLAANHELGPAHEEMLLSYYFGEVQPEHLRRLRLMRRASDMREAMWGFLQAGISRLEFDFLAYGHHHLQRFLATADA